MAHVISTQPFVYVSTTSSDTFTPSTAVKAPILPGYSINKDPIVESTSTVKMSKTTPKVVRQYVGGHTGATFSFQTYMKPYRIDAGNVTAVEKFLLDSLVGSTSSTADPFVVNFSSTYTLPELFIYLVFDDSSYYKINNAVVASATIDVSIENITSITWDLIALDMEYVETSLVTGTYTDYLAYDTFIRSKLSTIAISRDVVNYNLAITSGTITIENTVVLKQRNPIGGISIPTGHYVADRLISAEIECYLVNGVDSSSDLYTLINNESTLSGINALYDITLYIGGQANALRVELLMPTAKLAITDTSTGQVNSLSLSIMPQESVLGNNNEMQLRYNI